MNKPTKENAKEYLMEFATSQDSWLKALIYGAIETNGKISIERQNEISQHLLNNTALDIAEPNTNNNNQNTEIYITKLNHIQGVNALKENQTIKFNKNVTILYGLNGTGKSGYFKVLNEIVGGNQRKNILPNIYSSEPTPIPINIKLTFEEKEQQFKTIHWNGNKRSLDLLNKCRVFDSSYLNDLLKTRKADTTLIQPLGLNLFTYIASLMDEFKEKLIIEANVKKSKKPILEYQHLKENIKTSFESNQVNESIKKQVEGLYVFSDENSKKLGKITTKITDFKQTNIQDKITLINNNKSELSAIKDYIQNTHNKLSSYIQESTAILSKFLENKEANRLAKEQFSILSDIPANNTQEWKEFIKAGEKYKLKIENAEDRCVYCRQPLRDENAINLIKAYSNFLRDESEQALNKTTEDINSLISSIEKISTKLEIKEGVQKILKKQQNQSADKTISQIIEIISSDFELKKNRLLEKLINKDSEVEIVLFNVNDTVNQLASVIEKIKREIVGLSAENTNKDIQIKALEQSQKQLLQNQSISNQKDRIIDWFKIDTLEKKLTEKASNIRTNQISTLSKTAHNELLTENLKQSFINKLSKIGYSNLEVKIERKNTIKGVPNTRITLTQNKDVKEVLSEGEQKAVALALFIAETDIQKSKNPIILDDPVNSLDHKIADNFANILLGLDNQIILFNHNRLFLDAFETSRENHICKTIDSDCSKSKGKHIRIYQVNSEGQNSKGVLISYKSNKANNHIAEASTLLNKSPFEDGLKVASLLRKTVECVIDEVVFNNQLPTKYSNKNSRIDWGELKKLNNNNETINKLKSIHDRVSGGEMHNGIENEENPIEIDNFNTMISDIESILNPSVQ